MRKAVPLVLISLLFVGCGTPDEGSSSAGVSSSVGVSSSSSSAAKEGYAAFNANPQTGQTRYASCVGCHGADGSGPVSRIPVNDYESQQQLFAIIHNTMPRGAAGDCVDQCAADITAYLWTWRDSGVDTAACDTAEPVLYGDRALRLLTAEEYENSLEDLGIVSPADNYSEMAPKDYRVTLSKFPDNTNRAIINSYMDVYHSNARTLSDSAKSVVAAGCNNATACAQNFMDFAYKLFRRPLTEDDTARYVKFFNDYGADEGMRLALWTALSSPQFLYRSEMGIKVSDARANGWDLGTGGDIVIDNGEGTPVGDTGVTAGDPKTTIQPSEFSSGSVGADGFLRIPLYGNAGKTVSNYTFTGDDVILLEVQGMMGDGAWPSLFVRAGNKDIGSVEINSSNVSVVALRIMGVVGNNQYVQIENRNIGSHSNNRDLFLGEITLGKAVAGEVGGSSTVEVDTNADVEHLSLADADAYVLDPFEFASALSYMYTGSTPDDILLDAAAQGGLNTQAQVAAQIQRLLNSARGKEHVGRFAGQWLRTDEVMDQGVIRPDIAGFNSNVKNAMAEEIHQLFRYVFYNDNVPFEDFYAGNVTMANSILANFFGYSGSQLSGVQGLDSGWSARQVSGRGGVLTSSAFLTVNAHPDKTSPIKRAVRLRELMLCHHIDPPPALAAEREAQLALVAQKEAAGNLTSREYYEIVTDHPACDGCHKTIINPLFGMEDFDNVGRFRTTMRGLGDSGLMGLPIDNHGELIGTASAKGTDVLTFNGAKELGEMIADLPSTKACLIQNGFRYLAKAPIDQESVFKVGDEFYEPALTAAQERDYACVKAELEQAYDSNNSSPKALFSKLGTLDIVRFRK